MDAYTLTGRALSILRERGIERDWYEHEETTAVCPDAALRLAAGLRATPGFDGDGCEAAQALVGEAGRLLLESAGTAQLSVPQWAAEATDQEILATFRAVARSVPRTRSPYDGWRLVGV